MLKKLIPCLVFLTMAISVKAETYNAHVNIDFDNALINGVLSLKSEKDTTISLNLDGFYDVTVDDNPFVIRTEILEVSLKSGKEKLLHFTKDLKEHDILSENFISVEKITPSVIDGHFQKYILSATLPKAFEAVSSADTVEKKPQNGKNQFTFTINKPIPHFDLIASTEYKVKTERVGNTEVAVYFLKQNKNLTDKYLENTVKYIDFYEKFFQSPFPYQRFAVVEHIKPYGYATASYTVFGSAVIKLPFIIYTSLPHEILHQWFGSAIGLKEGGNWFEALATYYSDLGMLPTAEEKADYRKNALISYENYTKGSPYPLKDFQFNDSKLSQSIGYGKGVMMLQTIETLIGKEAFDNGIRNFIKNYLYKNASWEDIFASFQHDNLTEFAHYWLQNTHEPQLSVSDEYFTVDKGQTFVKFTLKREGGPEKMPVPYTVFYDNYKEKGLIESVIGDTNVSVAIKEANAKVVIDSDYEIMRRLTPQEIPATLSAILSRDDILGISENPTACGELFKTLKVTEIKSAKDVSLMDFTSKNIIVCGFDNPALKTVAAGLKADTRADSQYNVIKNPYKDGTYILAAENPLPENIRVLNHYGKYSSLKFAGGKNFEKSINTSESGIEVITVKEDTAFEPASARSVNEVIRVAELYSAVFVGERHDNYAHHLNQLEIIKRLHEKGHKLAVGFEMVHKPFQPALTAFINGEISEKDFLKDVNYYETWGFDYNLYAPLFRYLRDNKITALALNIDSSIIKKISSGNISQLTEDEINTLPKETDATNTDYEKQLLKIFKMHPVKEGAERAFSYFYMAQNTWDETMAETAVNFQKNNPDYKLIIIAGMGHLGKTSGIPLRYERLTGNKPFVIFQDDLKNPLDADVVINTKYIHSEGTPKLGVTINPEKGRLTVEKVDKNSPAEKGGIAKGDIIISCGSHDTLDMTSLKYALFEAGYGSNITCVAQRNGKNFETTMLLTHYETDDTFSMEKMAEMMKKMKKDNSEE